jgi:hypothetical protein
VPNEDRHHPVEDVNVAKKGGMKFALSVRLLKLNTSSTIKLVLIPSAGWHFPAFLYNLQLYYWLSSVSRFQIVKNRNSQHP